jgi:hypothetical protein
MTSMMGAPSSHPAGRLERMKQRRAATGMGVDQHHQHQPDQHAERREQRLE